MDRILSPGCGIDYAAGLKNCMGSASFYDKMLGLFVKDLCFSKAKSAFAENDRRELFARMHELKGMSGNVGLTALYNATVPLVELLRPQNGQATRDETASEPDVKRLFSEVESAYQNAVEIIEEHLKT